MARTFRAAAPKEMHLPNPRGETGRREGKDGEVAEWLKAHAWKVCLRETVTRVRIPLSPPANLLPSICLILLVPFECA